MKEGIEIEVVWGDQDLTEILFSCSNGRFSGQTKIYVGETGLPRLAEILSGFPRNLHDHREFDLGAQSAEYAGGGVKVRIYCRDSVGHAIAEVKLRESGCRNWGDVESLAMRIPLEAAGVDIFVRQLRALTKEFGAKAILGMAK